MAVALPLEPIYYYECFYGDSRLTYFIPYHMLEKLVNEQNVDAAVLKDFPLGIDLDCNEPDFQAFKKTYGYRPKYSAEAINQAFFAMYSSTRNWKKFRGTGHIPAKDLEKHIKPITKDLKEQELTIEQLPPLPKEPTSKAKKRWVKKKLNVQSKAQKFLRNLEVKEMDKRKNLTEQSFSQIKMEKGKESTKEFYSRLYKK